MIHKPLPARRILNIRHITCLTLVSHLHFSLPPPHATWWPAGASHFFSGTTPSWRYPETGGQRRYSLVRETSWWLLFTVGKNPTTKMEKGYFDFR